MPRPARHWHRRRQDALHTADALPGARCGGNQRAGDRGGQGGIRRLRPRAGVRWGAAVGRRAPAVRRDDDGDLERRRPAGARRAVRRDERSPSGDLRARGARPGRGHRLGGEVPRRPMGRDRGAPHRDRLRRRRVDTLTSGSGREAGPGGSRRGAGPGESAPGPAARAASVAARDSYGRLLALLAASTSDLSAAEDALADAFERAMRTWPSQGVPDKPDAWLLTVARNRLRDEWKSARVQRAVPLEAARDALT